eukprot:5962202-Lingulodinium_polyedra.AAC.1
MRSWMRSGMRPKLRSRVLRRSRLCMRTGSVRLGRAGMHVEGGARDALNISCTGCVQGRACSWMS